MLFQCSSSLSSQSHKPNRKLLIKFLNQLVMEITEDHPAEQSPTHQERRKQRADRKKKAGSLPLRMFLSIDDDTTNPKCVNSSNPFHKCGNSCYARAVSLPAKSVDGNKVEGFGGQSKCRHASNPFHVCSDSCRRGIAQHDGASGSSARKISGKAVSDKAAAAHVNVKRGVNPSCINASNPFHTCTESCFRKIGQKDGVKGVVGIAKQGNGHQSKCINASNPFHKCTDSCSQRIAAKDEVRGVVGIAKQGIDNRPKCNYASNPFHTCGAGCLGRKTGTDPVKTGGTRVVKEERREVPKIVEKKSVHPKIEDASEVNKTSVEDSIELTHEPDFLFFLRGVPSSRREQKENVEDSVRTEKVDVHQKTVNPDTEIAEFGQAKIHKPPSSPVVYTNFIYVLVYVAHLIVISAVYSKNSNLQD